MTNLMDTSDVKSLVGMKIAQDSGVKTSSLDPSAAKKAAQEFESLFLGQMMQHMMSSVSTDPVFGGGPGEDMFKSVMVDEWAKEAAKSGGVGLSSAIQRELLKTQEV